MIKDTILMVFKGMGIITASMIAWALTVGMFDTRTNDAAVYPSVFNKAIYENSLPVISNRMYVETDGWGTGYTLRTTKVYLEPSASAVSSVDSTFKVFTTEADGGVTF